MTESTPGHRAPPAPWRDIAWRWIERVARRSGTLALFALLATAGSAEARVTRLVVFERSSVAGGLAWGSAGPYERLKGQVFMEVDPADPLNALIVNLDKAPRNARGKVEFSSQFIIVKPVDLALANHKLWYGVNNRGECVELGFRSFPWPAANCNYVSLDEIGANNTLLKQGYIFVDAGWHGDGLPAPNKIFANLPTARQPDGSAITGPMRLEYQPEAATFTMPLLPGWRAYPAADTRSGSATLTVRDRADAPRSTVPAHRWAFGTCPGGAASLVTTAVDLCLFDGFVPGRIYELLYTARDPVVMGLAHAVTRDLASFLRYETEDDSGEPNPVALSPSGTGITRAYSSGTSSTGMYQREFLYLGFNEDEAHRKVFDAATIYSAGAYRLFANVQFAHPTHYAGQDRLHDYTANALAPFTFGVTLDPLTGTLDGLLKRPAFDPLVLQIDEEMTFWQWKASLNVLDSAGKALTPPDNVRLYFQGGFGHIGAAGLLEPPGSWSFCQHSVNGGSHSGAPTPRALVDVIDAWADRGIAPPASNYPRKADLVTLAQYRAAFPVLPGLAPPSVMDTLTVPGFGPDFSAAGGIQSVLPPLAGPAYALRVPRPTPDGWAAKGIDTLYTRVPLGSNTGWNVRVGERSPDLCYLVGSYLPFAATRAERLAKGDPRASLVERYRSRAGLVAAVRKATTDLVRERFLLPEDAQAYVDAARSIVLPALAP